MADAVRDIMSWLGRWIQVLSALNPVDPLHNCMFENKLWLQNVFAKNYFAMFRKLEIQYVFSCRRSHKENLPQLYGAATPKQLV